MSQVRHCSSNCKTSIKNSYTVSVQQMNFLSKAMWRSLASFLFLVHHCHHHEIRHPNDVVSLVFDALVSSREGLNVFQGQDRFHDVWTVDLQMRLHLRFPGEEEKYKCIIINCWQLSLGSDVVTMYQMSSYLISVYNGRTQIITSCLQRDNGYFKLDELGYFKQTLTSRAFGYVCKRFLMWYCTEDRKVQCCL